MKATDKLIEIIENNSKKDLGDIQINKDGIRYKYDYYYLKNPFHWVVKIFEKLRNEKYGSFGVGNVYDFRFLEVDKYTSIYVEYPQFKGQSPRKMTLRRLIILE